MDSGELRERLTCTRPTISPAIFGRGRTMSARPLRPRGRACPNHRGASSWRSSARRPRGCAASRRGRRCPCRSTSRPGRRCVEQRCAGEHRVDGRPARVDGGRWSMRIPACAGNGIEPSCGGRPVRCRRGPQDRLTVDRLVTGIGPDPDRRSARRRVNMWGHVLHDTAPGPAGRPAATATASERVWAALEEPTTTMSTRRRATGRGTSVRPGSHPDGDVERATASAGANDTARPGRTRPTPDRRGP